MSDEEILGRTTATNSGDSEPLTAELIQEAMRKITEAQTKQLLEQGGNASRFIEATPEHLRNHPFVVSLANLIAVGHIFHPKDAADARAEWERLCAEVLQR